MSRRGFSPFGLGTADIAASLIANVAVMQSLARTPRKLAPPTPEQLHKREIAAWNAEVERKRAERKARRMKGSA